MVKLEINPFSSVAVAVATPAGWATVTVAVPPGKISPLSVIVMVASEVVELTVAVAVAVPYCPPVTITCGAVVYPMPALVIPPPFGVKVVFWMVPFTTVALANACVPDGLEITTLGRVVYP